MKNQQSKCRAAKQVLKKQIFITCSPEETTKLAQKFAGKFRKGDVVALRGELGSGKTTFVQGLLNALGIKKFARSASFILANEYNIKSGKLFHIDLYRLSGGEINQFGLEQYFSENAVTVIEWADKLKAGALTPSFDIRFKWLGEQKRQITISSRIER